MKLRSGSAFVSIALVIALSAAACGGDGDDQQAGGEGGELQQVTVVIPNPSAMIVFPLWVAVGEGYFEEEGLEVRVEAVDGSGAVLQALAAGQAEIGLPGPGPTMGANAEGEEIVAFYNFFAQNLFGVVAPADSDIDEPEDVRGETFGVGTADGAEVSVARAIFSDAGLEEDQDYEFLPVGDGGQATAAFQRGEIVGYAAAISDMVIIETRGLDIEEFTPDEYLALFGNGWAAHASTIEEDPELIERFGRAFTRGLEFGLDNKEEAIAHAAEGNPEEGSDTELTDGLYEIIAARIQPLEDTGEGWGYWPPETWERWHEEVVESGELPEPLDNVEVVYTNEFVDAFNE
jgi:NitT/TauT family transport system substrate-binding protein